MRSIIWASEYFHFLLTEHKVGEKGREYLKQRGVSQAAIKQFFLGYSLDRWDGLATFLTKKKYSQELIVQSGLAIAKDNTRMYDRFRGRVMFPLRDPRGQIVGFAGRKIPSGVEGSQSHEEAKYINSPETPVYHKGKHLFGIYENKEEIRKANRAILVEGELDAISSWQAGAKNVVAVKGTALTSDQVKLIRRYTRNITMSLDTDSAGWTALVRSLPILEEHGMNVRVIHLPSGVKDPDDFAKANPVGWRTAVKDAKNVYESIISGMLERIGTSTGEQKKQASEEVIPILSNITNAVEQDHWIKHVAQELGVREEAVRKQIDVFIRSGTAHADYHRIEEKQSAQKLGQAELFSRYLLALFIQGTQPVPDKLDSQWLEPVGVRTLVEKFKHAAANKKTIQAFRQHLPPELHELFDRAALMIIKEEISDPAWVKEEVSHTLVDLERAWIHKQMSERRSSPSEISALTRRLQELSVGE